MTDRKKRSRRLKCPAAGEAAADRRVVDPQVVDRQVVDRQVVDRRRANRQVVDLRRVARRLDRVVSPLAPLLTMVIRFKKRPIKHACIPCWNVCMPRASKKPPTETATEMDSQADGKA